MSEADEVERLLEQKRIVENQIEKLKSLTEKGIRWDLIRPKIEELEGRLRRIEEEIVNKTIGYDEIKNLEAERIKVIEKLEKLEDMKRKGEVSGKVYKEMKERLQNELEIIEKRIVEAKLSL